MTNSATGLLATIATPNKVLGRRDHLTFRGNMYQGRHGWLRLTPAYSLHVVQEILSSAHDTDIVLDPFCGTGTTILVSAELGIPAHGVDINPFLVWLSNLKNRNFAGDTGSRLRTAAKQISDRIMAGNKTDTSWVPDIHQIEKWWDKDVLHVLSELFEEIKKQEKCSGNSATADLLKIAFCKVMIQNAHVSFGHQSMSFKKKQTNHSIFTSRDNICISFSEASEEIAQSLSTSDPLSNTDVFLGDSRKLDVVLPFGGYTKVITSPPYPNRMSYIRELRPYMYWLGYLNNGKEAGNLDWKAIGGTWGCATSLLDKWEPSANKKIPYSRFNRIVNNIAENHKILGRYVHKYFEDIKDHICSLSTVLCPHAQCFYVVGNSKFYGTVLPVEEIYASIFQDAGFVNVRVETIRKRTSKKELFEYIVYAEMH